MAGLLSVAVAIIYLLSLQACKVRKQDNKLGYWEVQQCESSLSAIVENGLGLEVNCLAICLASLGKRQPVLKPRPALHVRLDHGRPFPSSR